MSQPLTERTPTLADIRDGRERLGKRIRHTPVWRWQSDRLAAVVGAETEVYLKLELFQHTGSFKPRGAMLNMLALDPADLTRGVCAVSAGNHAMAVAYAARELGTTAKVVMPETANAARIDGSRALGAEIVLVPDVHVAFDEVRRIEREEKRSFIHPFEGFWTATGTATVGLELCDAVPELDAVIVPIGGGGLCAGVATAAKEMDPKRLVFGVEPVGADSMHRSFASGHPEAIEAVRTIADSLGAPHTEPYTFELCRRYVDDLCLVDDDELRRSMRLLFDDAKLGVEPAGAAATAALAGPLRDRLLGKRVGLIVCGSNIDFDTFAGLLRV